MKYRAAPEVKAIGQEIVREHHEHLLNTRIEYVFGDSVGNSGGKEVWGRARKKSGLDAMFAERHIPRNYDQYDMVLGFFIIEIAEPIWLQLSMQHRRALVDHELCHCEVDFETGKLKIRPHYVEDFPQILRRHGLWKADLQVFGAAAAEAHQQLSFTIERATPDEPAEDEPEPGAVQSFTFNQEEMEKVSAGAVHLRSS
jgi:hypothetical protein